MTEITLSQILDAREKRVAQQQAMLQKHQCPLVCFTMNIAGPVKNTPLIQRGFQAGMALLEEKLPKEVIRERFVDMVDTGNTAMYAVDMDALQLKRICTGIEESTSLGRLFDMDVLQTDGAKLERTNLRGCMVCGAPGRGCAAGRVHSVSELQNVTNGILQTYFWEADQKSIATQAVQSLIEEVKTTPKPGLVDQNNNGSHKDMTLAHFLKSANALGPYFEECVKIGQETAQTTPEETFLRLRQAGLDAEKTMFRATGGVNTHKGAIFTLGILCGSLGRLWRAEKPVAPQADLILQCAKMGQSALKSDFAGADGRTSGEQLYLQYGLLGIRGQVAMGLPSVVNIALPKYRELINAGLSQNDAGAVTLLHLIAQVEDTNLYHRGGAEGAKWASRSACGLLPLPSIAEIRQLDAQFIEKNLSPGGCADLLAVTYFLHGLYQ